MCIVHGSRVSGGIEERHKSTKVVVGQTATQSVGLRLTLLRAHAHTELT